MNNHDMPFFQLFFFSSSQMFSVNLLYENQKTHGAMDSQDLLVLWVVVSFFNAHSLRRFFKKRNLRVFTLKRVRLGLRALGRAFWAGLHCFSFKWQNSEGFTLTLLMWGLISLRILRGGLGGLKKKYYHHRFGPIQFDNNE